jgi:hypothetical protein
MRRKKKLPFNKDKMQKMSATGGLSGMMKEDKKKPETLSRFVFGKK